MDVGVCLLRPVFDRVQDHDCHAAVLRQKLLQELGALLALLVL